jgi:tetratricopeptide (TPR) repeat protein
MKDFPDLPDFYAEYGLLLFLYNSYEQAKIWLEKALLLLNNYTGMETSILAFNINAVYDVLGRIYEYENKYQDAIDIYQKILQTDKWNQPIFDRLYKLICAEDPVYCIAFLNTLYDKQLEADVTFLIQKIQKIQKDKILAYYLHVMNRLQGGDSVDILALECVGSYDRGRQSLLETMTDDLFFAASEAVLINDYSKIKDTMEFFTGSYKKIVLHFYEKSADLVIKKDFEIYQKMLLFILQTDEHEVIKKYCQLVVEFEVIQQLLIAKILKDAFCFKEAQSVYEHILSFDLVGGKKNILCDLAYCHYKLKEYKEAIFYFKQALQLDFNDEKIKKMVKWSEQNSLQMERVERK